jgi:hypothetical protein
MRVIGFNSLETIACNPFEHPGAAVCRGTQPGLGRTQQRAGAEVPVRTHTQHTHPAHTPSTCAKGVVCAAYALWRGKPKRRVRLFCWSASHRASGL